MMRESLLPISFRKTSPDFISEVNTFLFRRKWATCNDLFDPTRGAAATGKFRCDELLIPKVDLVQFHQPV